MSKPEPTRVSVQVTPNDRVPSYLMYLVSGAAISEMNTRTGRVRPLFGVEAERVRRWILRPATPG